MSDEKTSAIICKLDIKPSSGEPSAYNSPGSRFDAYPAALYQHDQDAQSWHAEAQHSTRLVTAMSSEPPRTTDRLCLWCMHAFDTPPVGMPTSCDEDGGKVVVSGVYCSMECAAAHNFDRHHASHTAYTRHAMLCELASKSSTTAPVHIRPAPPREMLDIFGGPMSIEAFRDRDKAYTVIYPLHVVSQPQHCEEIAFQGADSMSNGRVTRFVPIDEDTIDTFTSGLRRPVTSKRNFKSTLEYMTPK